MRYDLKKYNRESMFEEYLCTKETFISTATNKLFWQIHLRI